MEALFFLTLVFYGLPPLLVFVLAPAALLVIGAGRLPALRGRRPAIAGAGWAVFLIALRVLHDANVNAAVMTVAFLVESAAFLIIALRQPPLRRRLIGVGLVVTAFALLGGGVLFNVTPVVQFDAAAFRCGHEPVVGVRFFALDASDDEYLLPGDSDYGPSTGAVYFCSVDAAEAAHYSRSGS